MCVMCSAKNFMMGRCYDVLRCVYDVCNGHYVCNVCNVQVEATGNANFSIPRPGGPSEHNFWTSRVDPIKNCIFGILRLRAID